jgi:parallel beta-helix repeat protein
MSRSDFLRRAGVVGAGIAAAGLGLGGVASAATMEYDAVVYPEQGIAGVKAAANDSNVHSVLLKAKTLGGVAQAFDFTGDHVEIHQNKIIHGEPGTMIVGGGGRLGTHPIPSPDPNKEWLKNPRGAFTVMAPVAVEISHIHFDQSVYASVAVNAGNGVSITDNVITNPIGGRLNALWTTTWVSPIVVTEYQGAQGPIDGDVFIERNDILGVPTGIKTTDAIFCHDILTEINIFIRDNLTQSFAGSGISVNGSPNVTPYIEGNDIDTKGDKGISFTPFHDGNPPPKTVHVSQNTIEAKRTGIDCRYQNGSMLQDNTITINSDRNKGDAIRLFKTSNTTVQGNTLFGAVKNGISFEGSSSDLSDYNSVSNNAINLDSVKFAFYLKNANSNTVNANTFIGHSRRGIFLERGCNYNLIARNDLKQGLADWEQVRISSGANYNEFKNNEYGPTSGAQGFRVQGDNNTLVNENFWGNYGIYPDSPIPCVKIRPSADGTTVTALKYGQALQGFDLCTHIVNNGSNSNILGYEKCGPLHQDVIEAMRLREQAIVQSEMADCAAAGGTWDATFLECIEAEEEAEPEW